MRTTPFSIGALSEGQVHKILAIRTSVGVLAAVFLSATALQASSVIATCSQTQMANNTCPNGVIANFSTVLQWNALGSATGVPFTNTASVAVNGITVSISDSGGQMILADNYGLINRNGHWINPNILPAAPYRFSGDFDAPPDVAPAGFPPVGSPGDYLVGTYQNPNAMLVSLSGGALGTGVQGFAFRIASNSMTVFNATITAYSTADGSGPALASQTFTGLTGGGNCPGLFSNPPVPCNTAPWVVANGFNFNAQSFSIVTSDTSGFYVDSLLLEGVPEPGTMLFAGIGLLGLGYAIRRRRALRAAARTQAD